MHLHAVAYYKDKLRFKVANHLDLEYEGKTYHPNIKRDEIKSKQKALDYLRKQDPEPLCYNLDIEEETKARESHRRILGKRLIEGNEPLHKIVEEEPQLLFGLTKLKADLDTYKRLKSNDKPDLPATLPNPWEQDLPVHTDRKCRHYWIWSNKPNLGKTTKFLTPLSQQYRARFLN